MIPFDGELGSFFSNKVRPRSDLLVCGCRCLHGRIFVESGSGRFFLKSRLFARAFLHRRRGAVRIFALDIFYFLRHGFAGLEAKFQVTGNFGKRFLDSILAGRVIRT
jgi:hypothetical protein